jgi:hypothetical protein
MMGWENLSAGRPRFRSFAHDLFPGLLALLLALPFALLISTVNKMFPNGPERVVRALMVLFILLLLAPLVIYLLRNLKSPSSSTAALLVLLTATILLVAIYLFWVSSYVRFPADILTWSEGDFVGDILKFRVGYPIYSDQANNESCTYVPGPQLLTYFLAWLSGNPTSIAAYRAIQIGFAFLAALVAFLCCRMIFKLSLPKEGNSNPKLWSAISLPFLFLIATNSLSNPFVHALHDDSLAQLFSVLAYLLLLAYISKPSRRMLIAMALLPAAGFLIKQSLVIWAGFYGFHLAFFDKPVSYKRLALFGLISLGTIGVVIGGCYLIWGDPFIYWIFTVLGSHKVSPLRGFQHMLAVWAYYFLGFLGGFFLLRGKNIRKLLSPWLIWLGLISIETYTSGIAWMINHIGPGSLISGIWFLAGITAIWPELQSWCREPRLPYSWFRSALVLGMIGLLFSGLGVIRIPLPALPKDVYRYVHEIEKEFEGLPAKDVLLDSGTWVYVKERVIMKDRAPCIGERGYSETGDFSGIIQRLEQKHYSKILMRNLHSPEFFYDYWLWKKSSGIRKVLLENYHEVGLIKGVEGIDNPFMSPISILVRNSPGGAK